MKPDVVQQLNAHHQKLLQRIIFLDGCRSWYKGSRADGKVIGIWPGRSPSISGSDHYSNASTFSAPGSSLHYYETISEPRFEDFDYVYWSKNLWSYLGDGWTDLETKDVEMGGALDLAFYLTKPEEVLYAPDS